MYGVIQLKGHQYIVKKGDKIKVDRVDVEEGKSFVHWEVLALFDEQGKEVKLWAPFVKNGEVKLKVLSHFKGDKTNVIKFKNKTRYSRKYGFRPHMSELEVMSVGVKKSAAKKKETKTEKEDKE